LYFNIYFNIQFNQHFISLMPEFSDDTPKTSTAGWCQGAVKEFGKGRVAVWGEAAMFSAQKANNNKIGMNSPYARHNLCC
jgi:hypothetical protein